MKSFILLPIFFVASLASAEIKCPWANRSGLEMMQFDYSDDKNPQLTEAEIQEDLACLKILFQNKYVAQDDYPSISLTGRLQALSQNTPAMKSSQLIDLIYNLHQGMPDVHLAYQVNGSTKKYISPAGQQVDLNEKLDSEKVYNRDGYIYFKPAEILMPELTTSQKELIGLIKSGDKNLVLDLRETHGGGGSFPEELASNLFTPNQKIPNTKRLQVKSGLAYIGLSLTTRIVYGEQGKAFYESIKEYVKDKKFSELVPFTIEEQLESFQGKRPSEYKSKIFLLIDTDCASECETIVEKLTAHPNVVAVGANTRGALHYSNAVSFLLPNSGIWVRLPSLRHAYENGAPEGVGYAPKIRTNFINLDNLFQ